MDATELAAGALRDVFVFAAAGAQREKVNKAPRNWDMFFRLAHEHRVVPLVGCALLNSPELECPEN